MKIKILRSVSSSEITLKKGQLVESKNLPTGLSVSLLKAGFAEEVKAVKRKATVKGKKTT